MELAFTRLKLGMDIFMEILHAKNEQMTPNTLI